MAADESPLTVMIKAATDDFDKKMAASMRGVYREVDQLQKKFNALGPTNDNVANRIVKGSQQATGGMQKASQAAGQLSFQLNDIATSLAGGASPFQVMMQQGSQVTQVFQGMGGGIRGAGAALVGAFSSMLNPISLVSFGLIALTGVAYDYFFGTEEKAKKATDVWKNHAALIAGVKDQYELLGKAMDAIKSQPTKQETLLRLRSEISTISDAAAKLKTDLASVKIVESLDTAIGPGWFGGPEALKNFNNIKARTVDIFKQWDDGKATVEDVQKVLVTMAERSSDVNFKAWAAATVQQLGELAEMNRKLEDAKNQVGLLASSSEEQLKAQEALNKALGKMKEIASGNLTEMEKLLELYKQAVGLAQNLEDRNASVIEGQALKGYVAGRTTIEQEQAVNDPRGAGLEFLKAHASASAAPTLYRLEDAMIVGLVKLFQKLPDSARITQGVRTFQEQAEIRARHERMPGGVYAHPAARPGHSRHEEGTFAAGGAAVDISEGVSQEQLRAAVKLVPELEQLDAISESLYQRDKVHVQLAGTARKQEQEGAEQSVRYSTQQAELNARRDKAMLDYMENLGTQLDLETRLANIKMNDNLTDEEKLRAMAAEEELQKAINLAKEQHRVLTETEIANIRRTAIERTNLKIATDAYTESEKKTADAMKAFSQQMTGMAQSAISGLVNDLRNGVEAGEAFNNMLNRILDSLINMALQSLFSPQGLGGLFSTLMGVPIGATGGIVGETSFAKRNVSPAVFAGAPSMARGGIVGDPNAVPIIAHKGEMVVPKHLVGRGGGGGSTSNRYSMDNAKINIDMSNSGAVAANSEDAKEFGKNVQKLIQLEMVRESRPGGLLRKVPR